MERAKSILPRLFLHQAAPALDDLALIQGYWEETVGGRLARHARPVALEAARLTVEADSLAWQEQVAAMREQIVTFLRLELPGTDVRAIRIRLAAEAASAGEQARA